EILLLSKRLRYHRDPQTRLAHRTRLQSRTNSSLRKKSLQRKSRKGRKRAGRPARLPSHHDAEKSVAGEQWQKNFEPVAAKHAQLPQPRAAKATHEPNSQSIFLGRNCLHSQPS